MESNDFDLDSDDSKSKFEQFINKNKMAGIFILVGFSFLATGLLYFANMNGIIRKNKVEVIGVEDAVLNPTSEIIVELAGSVEKPGVYKMEYDSRINDLISLGGGLKEDADLVWFEKNVNKAAKLTDGQKIYIPNVDERSDVLSAKDSSSTVNSGSGENAENNNLINVNTASLSQLDSLPGIGPVYGQSIIDHRPYSSVDELLSKGALKKNIFEKVKNYVSVY